MQEHDPIASLRARVEALEEFVRDMAEAAATMKLLAAQHARDIETAFGGYAEQIRERCAALAAGDGAGS